MGFIEFTVSVMKKKTTAPGALETDSTMYSVKHYGTTMAQPSMWPLNNNKDDQEKIRTICMTLNSIPNTLVFSMLPGFGAGQEAGLFFSVF